MTTPPTLLVSGAGGKLGRRVVEILLARGGAKLVAGTRDPAKLADLAAKGVEVRALDFDDPASLAAAFAGIDRALIVSTDALMVEGQRTRQHEAAVAAAVEAGVGHIVYTSMPDPDLLQFIPIAPSHLATEVALEASGVPHTVLRNAWYADMLVDTLKGALASGQWVTSQGEGKVAYVTREDCAQAAAAALAADTAASATYDVTGPAALSAGEIAAIARELTGRPLEVVTITEEQMAGGMRSAGVPDPYVRLATTIERVNREGGVARVTDTIEKLTGQKPQSVADFLAAHKAELAE